jgi:hypothetical protein
MRYDICLFCVFARAGLQAEAQEKMQALELEKQTLAKKLAAQVESTKNAEKDMRLMYTRHKKQMQVSVNAFPGP